MIAVSVAAIQTAWKNWNWLKLFFSGQDLVLSAFSASVRHFLQSERDQPPANFKGWFQSLLRFKQEVPRNENLIR